jgi:N-dimethylarginine dimethylaminohydrolase
MALESASLHRGERQGECDVRPSGVLVHDPVAAGAFQSFAGYEDGELLEQELLFRGRPDVELYAQQHRAMVRLISEHVPVTYLSELVSEESSYEISSANPNQVFTRDSLITIPWLPGGYMPARMKRTIRRAETATMEAAVAKLGLEPIVHLPEGSYLEGGDLIPFSRDGRRTLLVGFGRRTAFESLEFLRRSSSRAEGGHGA